MSEVAYVSPCLTVVIIPEGSPILKYHTVLLKHNTVFNFYYTSIWLGIIVLKSEDRSNGDLTLLAPMTGGPQGKKRNWFLGARKIKGIGLQICWEFVLAHHDL